MKGAGAKGLGTEGLRERHDARRYEAAKASIPLPLRLGEGECPWALDGFDELPANIQDFSFMGSAGWFAPHRDPLPA